MLRWHVNSKHTVGVPLVVTGGPRQLALEAGEQEVEAPANEHVVVDEFERAHNQQRDAHSARDRRELPADERAARRELPDCRLQMEQWRLDEHNHRDERYEERSSTVS